MNNYCEYIINKNKYLAMTTSSSVGGGDKSDEMKEIIFVRHAETIMNTKKVRYDNFGPDEYYPITDRGVLMAKETGKYLTKYGDFDLIISSPRDRCIQTAEQIAKEIKYDKKIETSDLLLENNAGKLQLMLHNKIDDFINENKRLSKLKKESGDEKNEFKKLILNEKFSRKFYKYTEQTNREKLEENYKEFLSDISKSKHKRILVVCHSGTIYHMRNIICNIGYWCDVKMTIGKSKEDFFNGNCYIMGIAYRSKDNKFYLVIPPNNQHLEDLAKKI